MRLTAHLSDAEIREILSDHVQRSLNRTAVEVVIRISSDDEAPEGDPKGIAIMADVVTTDHPPLPVGRLSATPPPASKPARSGRTPPTPPPEPEPDAEEE